MYCVYINLHYMVPGSETMRLNIILTWDREKEVKIFSSGDDFKSNEYETDKASKVLLVQRMAKLLVKIRKENYKPSGQCPHFT